MVLQEFKEIMLHFFFVFGQTTKQPLPLLWGKREFKGQKSAVFAVLRISFICSHRAFTKSWLNHSVHLLPLQNIYQRTKTHRIIEVCIILYCEHWFQTVLCQEFLFHKVLLKFSSFWEKSNLLNIDFFFFYKMLLPHSRYPKIF